MAPLKYFLVMNPTARSGGAYKQCRRIISEMKLRKVDFDYQMTSRKDEAVDISRQAGERDYDVVVAVGGDGTICEVITGLRQNSPAASRTLGVLHVGTSPDFNRYCHIPVRLDEALEALLAGRTRSVDVGKVSFRDLAGDERVFYFGSSVNVGLGPHIAGKANSRYRKYLGDFLGTLVSSLTAVWNFQGVDLKVKIDGEKTDFTSLINLTVGKDPYLASGMRVFSDVLPDDGKLFLFSLRKGSLFSLLANVPKLYVGDFMEYKHAGMRYGRKVEVCSEREDVFIEFDGDMRGKLPATIEVLPKSLEVIVS